MCKWVCDVGERTRSTTELNCKPLWCAPLQRDAAWEKNHSTPNKQTIKQSNSAKYKVNKYEHLLKLIG